MAFPESVTNRLHQPEYTGENRCIPCTVVNMIIATGLSLGLGILSVPLGAASFATFMLVIYLRGYLIPGTPTLTRRYFPDRVLRLFDKEPLTGSASSDVAMIGDANEVDPEPILRSLGVLIPCRDGEDLCLTDEFATAWRDQIATVRNGDYVEYLATLTGRATDELTVVSNENDGVTVTLNGTPLAKWESKAALISDLSAATQLRNRYSAWDGLNLSTRGQLSHSLRPFLEQCPVCDAPVTFSERTVKSCCRTAEVVALDCEGCNARVLEVEV